MRAELIGLLAEFCREQFTDDERVELSHWLHDREFCETLIRQLLLDN